MQFIQPFGAKSQHTPTRMTYFSVARGDERSKGENNLWTKTKYSSGLSERELAGM